MSSNKSYDVAVVGAGVIGLSCAWRAAERGLSVLVLDRDKPGAGASGVAAGMLAPLTEASFGEQALLELNLEAAGMWPGFAVELEATADQAPGYRPTGALVVAADGDEARELRRLHEFQRALSLETSWLSARACRALEPGLSPRIAGGILAPADGHADPQALVSALVAACERAGADLAFGVEVEGLVERTGAVAGVRTSAGDVSAGHVVVAAGAWSAEVGGHASPPVRPVKGQIVSLRVRPAARPPADRVVRSPRCYVVSRPGGRIVVGATMEERGFDAVVTAGGIHTLLDAARELLPDVDELELERAHAGLRPGTPDNLPVVGEDGETDGLIWATGHHRNGILLAPPTAMAVAGILGGDPAGTVLERCSPRRFAAAPAGARE